jgi:hypothetical protein
VADYAVEWGCAGEVGGWGEVAGGRVSRMTSLAMFFLDRDFWHGFFLGLLGVFVLFAIVWAAKKMRR